MVGFVAFKNTTGFTLPALPQMVTVQPTALDKKLLQENELLAFAKTLKTPTQESRDTATSIKQPSHLLQIIPFTLSNPIIIGIITLGFCVGLIFLTPQLIKVLKLAINEISILTRKLLLLLLVAGVIAIVGVVSYFVLRGLATEWVKKEKPDYRKGCLQGVKKGTSHLLKINNKEKPLQKKKGLGNFIQENLQGFKQVASNLLKPKKENPTEKG
jgi:hypothetical protein